MADINHVWLVGRLTRDAEVKYTIRGKAVAKFSIAVNERRKDGDQWKDHADFFELVLWGQLAESLQNYLKKGKQVGVVGKLSQERWEQSGEKRSKVIVNVQNIQLFNGSGSDTGQNTLFANDGNNDEIPL